MASAEWVSLFPTVAAAAFLFMTCGELARSLSREAGFGRDFHGFRRSKGLRQPARSLNRAGEVGCNFHTTTNPSNSTAAAAIVHTRQAKAPLRRGDAASTVVAAPEASNRARNARRRECSTLKGASWFHTAAFTERKAAASLRWSDKWAAHGGQLRAWSTAPGGLPASAPPPRASSTTIWSNWWQSIAPTCNTSRRGNSGRRPKQFLQQQAACAMQPGSHRSHGASE